jgi:solute carrier family 20 (sodium-dependent phosphate transporter)
MLGMMCALMSNGAFGYVSSYNGWPTSTTHGMVGALIGIGLATGAGVNWGYYPVYTNGTLTGQNGMSAVVASFAISPIIAGCIGIIIYTAVNYVVLKRKGYNAFWWALRSAPFWYALVAGFEAFLISWKSPRYSVISNSDSNTAAVFWGAFLIVGLLTQLFIVPFIFRTVWLGWSNLTAMHLPLMIFPDSWLKAWFPWFGATNPHFDTRHLRNEEIPEDEMWQWSVKDLEELYVRRAKEVEMVRVAEEGGVSKSHDEIVTLVKAQMGQIAKVTDEFSDMDADEARWKRFVRDMKDEKNSVYYKVGRFSHYFFFFGLDREIADYNAHKKEVQDLHDPRTVTRHNGKAEQVFRFLQVLTCAIASFAHGANDVGITAGPTATIYALWTAPNGYTTVSSTSNSVTTQIGYQTGGGTLGVSAATKAGLQDWMLAMCAGSICMGLWFYGFNRMRTLGNRLTFHSPSRGFCMEMGAAITILLAARNGVPVSTTNCIVGATVGVGLVSNFSKGVNWRLAFLTVLEWLITLPFTAIVAGCFYAFIAYSPTNSCNPTQILAIPSTTANTTSQVLINGQYYWLNSTMNPTTGVTTVNGYNIWGDFCGPNTFSN